MAPVMAGIVKANPDLRVIYKELTVRGAIATDWATAYTPIASGSDSDACWYVMWSGIR